jgi:excisionase family DNA binding protein
LSKRNGGKDRLPPEKMGDHRLTYKNHRLMERLLNVATAAELCDVHEATIRRMIKRGLIRAVRIGNSVRIPESEITRISNPYH